MVYQKLKENSLNFLTLFTSFSTLICCALPALLVSLGLGASLVGVLSYFPELIWLSNHKGYLFLFGGSLLFFGGVWQFKARSLPCPIDPKLKASCIQGRELSFKVYLLSLFIYLIGLSFAYILPHLN